MLNPSDIPLRDDPADEQISEFAAYALRWANITGGVIVTLSVVFLIIAFSM